MDAYKSDAKKLKNSTDLDSLNAALEEKVSLFDSCMATFSQYQQEIAKLQAEAAAMAKRAQDALSEGEDIAARRDALESESTTQVQQLTARESEVKAAKERLEAAELDIGEYGRQWKELSRLDLSSFHLP